MSSSTQSTETGREATQKSYYVREGEEGGSGATGRPWSHLFARTDGEDHKIGQFATDDLACCFRDSLEDDLDLGYQDGGLDFPVMKRVRGNLVSHLEPGYFEITAYDFDCWCFNYEGEEFAEIRGVGSFYPYLFFRMLTLFDWPKKDVRKWKAEYDRIIRESVLKNLTEDPTTEHAFRVAHALGSFDINFTDLEYALICWRGYELPATSPVASC